MAQNHQHSQKQHYLAGKNIAIAGCGIAGIAFCVALKKQWNVNQLGEPPSITIYERDAQEDGLKREGYSLSLDGQDRYGGLYALLQLGVIEEICDAAVIGKPGAAGQEAKSKEKGCFKLWNSNFNEIISLKPKAALGLPTAVIRIARRDLRNILVQAALNNGCVIKWSTSCVGVQRLETGRVQLQMARHGGAAQGKPDELRDTVDLVIAADGASSKLRACLRPNDNVQFRGSVQMGGSAKFADNKLPKPLDINWGGVVTGKGVFCFFSPIDDHSLVWALSKNVPSELPRLDTDDGAAVQKLMNECLDMGLMIAQPFETLVRATDPATAFVINTRDKEPFAHDLSVLGPVVFVGDANHAVSPFSGYGANLALRDGWFLAEKLTDPQLGSLQTAVDLYDQERVPRARKIIETSHGRIRTFHNTGLRYWAWRVVFGGLGWILWLLGK